MQKKGFITFYAAIFPFILLMAAVLLVFQPWFLNFEYTKADFPADAFGFSPQERLRHGTDSIRYITNNQPESFLAGLTTDDEQPLYNERELSHMKDVKSVYQSARTVWVGLIITFCVLFLALKKQDQKYFLRTVFQAGSLATLIGSAAILAAVMLAFQPMFTLFHQLFFSEGTWLFYIDDSLIRLFPEKLWIDGFFTVGALTVALAIIFLLIGRRIGLPKKHPGDSFNELKQ